MRPAREPARNNQQTYFVTFTTAQRTPFFRHERWLELLLAIVRRNQAEFQLHDYVVMPDHVHLLVTPAGPLERMAQLIKGGFSFQAKREFEWKAEIWQRGFSDHRIRDDADFETHIAYIRKDFEALNETQQLHRGRRAGDGTLSMLPGPPRLKPISTDTNGAAKAAPFQNTASEAFAIGPNVDGEQNSL